MSGNVKQVGMDSAKQFNQEYMLLEHLFEQHSNLDIECYEYIRRNQNATETGSKEAISKDVLNVVSQLIDTDDSHK